MKRSIFFWLFYTLYYIYTVNAQQPLGIDVSHHQGNIDWSLVYNAGKVFAFVKATEGYTYNDPMFVTNMENGTQAGVWMGAYHFARPDNNSATDEAHHFVQIAGNYIGPGYLPPVLDLEDPPGTDLQTLYTSHELTQWVRTWLETVEQLTGVEPIIYTNGRYTQYLETSLTTYKLWIAEPDGNTDPPDNLNHWSDWAFKQYSWTGNVPGISGDVDLDVFNGTMEELENLVYPSSGWDCYNASSIDCNQLEHINESTDSSHVQSYACTSWNEPGPERIHTFTAGRERNVSVIISGYNGDLDVFGLNACDSTACAGTAYESSFNFSNITAGSTYYIVVDAKDGSGSAYDIFVRCNLFAPFHDFSVNNANITTGDTLAAGSFIDVALNTYYAGTSDTLISITNAYYLSLTPQLNASAILLDTSSISLNSNHRMEHTSKTLQIPDTLAEGDYYLLFVTDAENTVAEATEENNMMAVAVHVNGQSSVSLTPEESFILYPNPASGQLFIRQKNGKEMIEAALFDISGKRLAVTPRKKEENLWEIPLENRKSP